MRPLPAVTPNPPGCGSRITVYDSPCPPLNVPLMSGLPSGRRGTERIVNDFVQVIRLADGRVSEVWNYYWDQRAIAEFMPVVA